MARKKKSGGDAQRLDIDEVDLFPELDKSNPKHKELLSATKRLYKVRAERRESLDQSKQKVRTAENKVKEMMKALELKKFRYDGVSAEIVEKDEVVEVKIGEDVEADEEGEEETLKIPG